MKTKSGEYIEQHMPLAQYWTAGGKFSREIYDRNSGHVIGRGPKSDAFPDVIWEAVQTRILVSVKDYGKLTRDNTALLDALKVIIAEFDSGKKIFASDLKVARAAITQAESAD